MYFDDFDFHYRNNKNTVSTVLYNHYFFHSVLSLQRKSLTFQDRLAFLFVLILRFSWRKNFFKKEVLNPLQEKQRRNKRYIRLASELLIEVIPLISSEQLGIWDPYKGIILLLEGISQLLAWAGNKISDRNVTAIIVFGTTALDTSHHLP